jgi:hypothetical protein
VKLTVGFHDFPQIRLLVTDPNMGVSCPNLKEMRQISLNSALVRTNFGPSQSLLHGLTDNQLSPGAAVADKAGRLRGISAR